MEKHIDMITFGGNPLTLVGEMVKENGGKWFKSINEVSDFLNFDKNL